MKKLHTIILMMWCCVSMYAQRHIMYSDDMASLQVVAGTRWQEMPIIRLNGVEPINISFDILSHEYRRLTYSITHLEYDFTESDALFTSDYISGFQDGATIDDYEESINTTQNYTHYTLQIPNSDCALRMSGNYRLDIKDDNNDDNILASVYFMVYEDLAAVSVGYTVDTDIDLRKNHQQVEVKVDYSKLNATDPRQQIKGYVIQNGRWDNAVTLPAPMRLNQQYMEWEHCRDLIFEAGNEYHKFEILDVHRNSMNVEENVWDGETWHTLLWNDYARHSYVYDETAKGAFYIRNTDNQENDVTSEYVKVHFTLKTEPFDKPLYLNGVWTNDRFDESYLMTYNAEKKMYEGIVSLKYGYYSYQYLLFDGKRAYIPPTEGSFYETRNNYTTLIYYRANGDRTDRLVGIGNYISTKYAY